MKSSAGLLLLPFAWNMVSGCCCSPLGGRGADSALLRCEWVDGGGGGGVLMCHESQQWFLSVGTRIPIAPRGI